MQIVMASGLRWLAGCPCLDIHISMGISLPSVYRFRDIFLVSVNSTPELNLVFPQTNAEIRKASQDFRTRSKSGIMAGCMVASMDTWLQLRDQDWTSATGTCRHIFLDITVFMA